MKPALRSLCTFAVASLAVPFAVWAENPSSAPKPAAATASSAATPQVDNGYLKLGFEQLASYQFNPPAFDPAANPNAKPPTGEEQIPANVKTWNGKKAVITGYMVPVKME